LQNWQQQAKWPTIRYETESKKDKLLQGMLKDAEAGQSSGSKSALEANEDSIAYLHSLIYVPQVMRKEIIRMHHDLLMSGH
jgi:hypothetical protein